MTVSPCCLDLCALRRDHSQWGVVYATASDYENMYQLLHEAQQQNVVGAHPSISAGVQTAFYTNPDYAPPRGTIVVWFPSGPNYTLIPEHLVEVISRRYFIGDVVIRKDRPDQTGVVVRTKSLVRLQTTCIARLFGTGHVLPCLTHATSDHSAAVYLETEPAHCIVHDVELSDLRNVVPMATGDAVLFKGWAGTIQEVQTEKIIQLFNGSIVIVPPEAKVLLRDLFEIEAHDPGSLVSVRKADLRNGKWRQGQYDPNAAAIGVILDIQPFKIKVHWQYHPFDSRPIHSLQDLVDTAPAMPPEYLGQAEIQSQFFFHYSLEFCFGQDRITHDAYCGPSSAPIVRFIDKDAALAEYGRRPNANKLFQHGQDQNGGYDMNIFQLAGSISDVTVQWQDTMITHEVSTNLLKAESGDHPDLFPGTIVRTVELKGPDENPVAGIADCPKKVGVIQSVTTDCLARVRWFRAPHVHLDQQHEFVTDAGYHCGELSDEVEDVSTYDLAVPGGLDFVRLDFVRIRSRCNDPLSIDERTWIGHIIEIHNDATLTIRLGAAKEPTNLRLHIDEIDFALDPIGAEDPAAHDEDIDMDAPDGLSLSDQSMLDDDELGRILMGDRTETVDIIMEGGASPRSYRSGTENADAWSTASEGTADRDTSDPDVVQNGSKTPDNRETNGGEAESHIEPPPQYVLHDGTAPEYHKHAKDAGQLSGPTLRKVMKEHTILSQDSAIPSGIYVQSWEGNCNLFRALIFGPAETPYAHCPFVFDILLPTNYPQKPPTVFFYHWRTQHHRRINPNLYEDGYVCLSLLNTWPGEASEGWQPGKSTLLQALISIQSLILVPEPYYSKSSSTSSHTSQISKNR
ncbi:hypothetical protein K461DRAFT_281567 [Myriangium duriaei CBS 260.36]|uniref:UBC core domain-containing protein n=1 Tax=Myriangium duriaei CBS 260.36 TaxID=1168546 RepID=A0A9P4IWX6_9PEZI|nr:hypothetical protein K461DRAFT_281567 [Myriangium duriaei CBS 260.36]